ncbi:MAG TPA: DUF4142 domain-containing protein [Gemmatimonadaceae bacterium]|nr:DUF4142 domain-containing protein [Gemmatimonadaceae bacterium]
MIGIASSRRFGFLVAAVGIAAMAACGEAADDRGDTLAAGGDVAMSGDSAAGAAARAMDVPTTDAGAVEVMTTIDEAEVEAGQLAVEKARNDQVRAFAREMVQAHGRNARQVEQLAQRAGVTTGTSGARDTGAAGAARTDTGAAAGATMGGTGVLAALHESHQRTMQRLRDLQGADFDSAYIAAMVSGHQQALDILQRAQNNVSNAQLEQHFTEAISTVRQHLDRAREVQQGLGTRTGDTTQAGATGRDTTHR